MPLCSCGCGEPIPELQLFRYKPPYFLRGHVPEYKCACGCGESLPKSPNQRYREQAPQFKRGHRNRTSPPAPAQPCACGCGQLTTVYKGKPRTFISGHNSVGMKRGEGRYINNFGYVMIRMPNHPQAQGGYVREHRWVMEQAIGRPLTRHEDVHHLNGDKTDNRIENLQLLHRREHGALHGWPDGRSPSAEHREKLAAQMRRVWDERRRGERPMPNHAAPSD